MKLINLKACFIGMLVFSSAGMADTFAVKDGVIFDAPEGKLEVQAVSGSLVDVASDCALFIEDGASIDGKNWDSATGIVISDGLAIVSTEDGFDTYNIESCLNSALVSDCEDETEIDLEEGEIHLCLEVEGELHEFDMMRLGSSANWRVTGVIEEVPVTVVPSNGNGNGNGNGKGWR